MAYAIEDGTGSGQKAKVEHNRLLVTAKSQVSEEAEAEDGNSFIIYGSCRTAAATSGLFLHITNNDANSTLHVSRIYIHPETLTDPDLMCKQIFDSTPSGGSDITASAVVNKNRTSANAFDLTVIASDAAADATYTGGTVYHKLPLESRKPDSRNMNGTNILGKGNSIAFAWELEDLSAAVDDQIVNFSINITKVSV